MPANLLNQPDDIQLADDLRNLLGQEQYDKFDALVAFAVSSGVLELQEALESLLGRGGSIRIVVGVSRKVTSVEGLKLLFELVQKGAEVFIFHNDTSGNPIFHPKLYLCRGDKSAVLIVGSNNLTGKGLVGNYELSIAHELDPNSGPDADLLASALKTIDKYCEVSGGFSHALDQKFIEELEAEGYIGSEARGTNKPETSGEEDDESGASGSKGEPKKKLFASKSVPQSKKRGAAPGKGAATPPLKPPAAAAAPSAGAVGARGPLLWEKTLTPTDAQRQPGHVTSEVRLTQAGWKVGGKMIDQRTYFRKTLFGGFNWNKTKTRPYVREQAPVRFDITLLGKNIGVHRLLVSDKPSGEAGQGNYTSALHWGNLRATIRAANVQGKTLKLYGPPQGSTEPFFIEIV